MRLVSGESIQCMSYDDIDVAVPNGHPQL